MGQEGDWAAVAQHLRAGGDVNARTVYQSQLLHVAARHGRPALVALLLAHPGVEIDSLDYVGLLPSACSCGGGLPTHCARTAYRHPGAASHRCLVCEGHEAPP